MNFQLTKTYRYWWPVTVRIPHPDEDKAGKVIEQTFSMQFEPQDRDAVIADQVARNEMTDITMIAKHEHDALKKACKDWKDVIGDDKKPVPFTNETFEAALQKTWFRDGVYKAFNESMTGSEARLGN
tara:strand:+ start:1847 stop:2227 length:381 start_codon:yes stop_codon:yes gene_type:complete